jgi:hypothetical protein
LKHPPTTTMKHFRARFQFIVFLGFSLISVHSAMARIGESITRIEERYGTPIGKTNVFPENHKELEYKYEGVTIRVSFIDDISVIEHYHKIDRQPLSTAEIDYLLAANLRNGKWTPNGSQSWTADSKQARASYSEGDNGLTIIAKAWDDYLKDTTEKSKNSGDKFLGAWASDKYGMSITRDGDIFIVKVTMTSGWQGLQGSYTAKLVNGNLQLNPPMLGEATLSGDGTRIYWYGDQWRKR